MIRRTLSRGNKVPSPHLPLPLVPQHFRGWHSEYQPLFRIPKRQGTSPIERVHAKINELTHQIQTNTCRSEIQDRPVS